MARLVEAILGQIAALGLVAAFLLWSWWVAVVAVAVTVLGLSYLIAVVFPLVPLEAAGSSAGIRRSAVRFWLLAPAALTVTILLVLQVITK